MKDIGKITKKEDAVDRNNKRIKKQLSFRYWFGWNGSPSSSKKGVRPENLTVPKV
ncbi:hypothetical protein [Aggregatimonas sangjinii]|uniref:hypothetical protein n=1 Tax=Aggregatimonas sangjinii TaxID=2583587 RepID=UPI001586F7EB|nr:hypothetical protein [Aggregatimonas sangjinii]